MPAGSAEAHGSGDEAGAGDVESERLSQAECAQDSALHPAEADSPLCSQTPLSTTQTTDSGFSEPTSQDPQAEKETSCEKAVRPEGDETPLFQCFYLS